MNCMGRSPYMWDVVDKRPIREIFLDAMEEQGGSRNNDFNGIDQAGCVTTNSPKTAAGGALPVLT